MLSPPTSEDSFDGKPKTIDMALYSLTRARKAIAKLEARDEDHAEAVASAKSANNPSQQPAAAASAVANLDYRWTNADTASFDCMHYNGDAALDLLAQRIDLQPDQTILDIGSGFSATGRYLATRYHARVIGIELQQRVHDLAELITRRNVSPDVRDHVASLCGDIVTIATDSEAQVGERQFDAVVSLLCIMHVAREDRPALFSQAWEYTKPGGWVFVEDFVRREGVEVTDAEEGLLRDVVACPYLPSVAEYVRGLEKAGFVDVLVEDLAEEWRGFVVERAERYKGEEGREKEMEVFYDAVAGLFEGGHVGGARFVGRRRQLS
ncbi:hypothetical protein MMC21_006999 [Puttea exsequens]|nr:hypothetical protein [Puttea exsequens]